MYIALQIGCQPEMQRAKMSNTVYIDSQVINFCEVPANLQGTVVQADNHDL